MCILDKLEEIFVLRRLRLHIKITRYELNRIKRDKEFLRIVLNSKGFNIPDNLTLRQWGELILKAEDNHG